MKDVPVDNYRKQGEQLNRYCLSLSIVMGMFAIAAPFATELNVRIIAALGFICASVSSFVLAKYIRELSAARIENASLRYYFRLKHNANDPSANLNDAVPPTSHE